MRTAFCLLSAMALLAACAPTSEPQPEPTPEVTASPSTPGPSPSETGTPGAPTAQVLATYLPAALGELVAPHAFTLPVGADGNPVGHACEDVPAGTPVVESMYEHPDTDIHQQATVTLYSAERPDELLTALAAAQAVCSDGNPDGFQLADEPAVAGGFSYQPAGDIGTSTVVHHMWVGEMFVATASLYADGDDSGDVVDAWFAEITSTLDNPADLSELALVEQASFTERTGGTVLSRDPEMFVWVWNDGAASLDVGGLVIDLDSVEEFGFDGDGNLTDTGDHRIYTLANGDAVAVSVSPESGRIVAAGYNAIASEDLSDDRIAELNYGVYLMLVAAGMSYDQAAEYANLVWADIVEGDGFVTAGDVRIGGVPLDGMLQFGVTVQERATVSDLLDAWLGG